jgi:putative hemolysin
LAAFSRVFCVFFRGMRLAPIPIIKTERESKMKTLRVLITIGGLTLISVSASATDCGKPGGQPVADTKTFSQLTVTLSTQTVSSEIVAKNLSASGANINCSQNGDPCDFVLSTSCLKGSKLDCDAYDGLKKAVAHGLPQRKGGANPGAVLCSEAAGGKAIVSLDDKGNQSSFCQFPDGSVVSMGSLRRAAAANQ